MKYRCLLLALLLGFSAGNLVAQEATDVYDAKIFQAKNGKTIPYRQYTPQNMDPKKKYPLVLFFHGAGERGTENVKVLQWGLMPLYAYLKANQVEAIIIAPQCAPSEQWVDTPWGLPSHTMPEKPSGQMSLSIELLKSTASTLPVDQSRIYVTGLSMGGFGAWDIVQRIPELFAAAMPVCGGGDIAQAKQFKDVPVWAFHGSADGVVIPERSREMVAAIKSAGGNAKLTEFPTGHAAWKPAYKEKAHWDWLFEQKKK